MDGTRLRRENLRTLGTGIVIVQLQSGTAGFWVLVLAVRVTNVLEHLVVWQASVRPGEAPGLGEVYRVLDRNAVFEEIRCQHSDTLVDAHLVAVRHAAKANLLL